MQTRLTAEREKRGWSKAELARRSDLHPSQIGLFEAGRLIPYSGQLLKLARGLEWPESEADLLMEKVATDEFAAA